MRKIEIIDANGVICIKEYLSLNSKTARNKMYNNDAYEYLNYNTRYQIKNIYQNGDQIQIEYENFLVCCKVNTLLNFYVSPLLNQVNRYTNKKNSLNHKGKKVTRKNKHVNKSVIAIGMVLVILLAKAASGKKKTNDEITTSITIENELSDENIEVNEEDVKNLDKGPEEIAGDNLNFVEEETQKENDDEYELRINYSDFSRDSEKLEFVKENYGDIIEYYANMYGLDPNIMIAIATQERGVHSPEMDIGGATGLMQIQNSVWIGEHLKVFNYDLDDQEEITVTSDMLSDLNYNIKLGCMIFSDTMRLMKNNVLAAIQCYNMGYGSMMKILSEYGYEVNKSTTEILNNPKDIGWLGYRDIVGIGDSHYLEKILSYIGDKIHIESMGTDLAIETTSKTR